MGMSVHLTHTFFLGELNQVVNQYLTPMYWRKGIAIILFWTLYNTVNWENFARVLSRRRSFAKIKPSRNGKITLLFTDVGTSCSSHEFVTSQKRLLTLFAKIRFSQIFSILQYRFFFFQFILLFAWIDYTPVKYGDYNYPGWADAIGWLLALASVICIPAMMIRKLYKEDESNTIIGVS